MEIETIGFRKIELSMTAGEANVRALVFIIPILLLYPALYLLLWPEQFASDNLRQIVQTHRDLMLFSPLVMLGVFLVGAVLHELLHGLT